MVWSRKTNIEVSTDWQYHISNRRDLAIPNEMRDEPVGTKKKNVGKGTKMQD